MSTTFAAVRCSRRSALEKSEMKFDAVKDSGQRRAFGPGPFEMSAMGRDGSIS